MAQKSSTRFALLRLGFAVAAAAFSVAAASSLAGCGAPAARCPLTVWYRPAHLDATLAGLSPELVGSWDNWARPGLRRFTSATADDGTVWSSATLELAPGTYQYAIMFGGARV